MKNVASVPTNQGWSETRSGRSGSGSANGGRNSGLLASGALGPPSAGPPAALPAAEPSCSLPVSLIRQPPSHVVPSRLEALKLPVTLQLGRSSCQCSPLGGEQPWLLHPSLRHPCPSGRSQTVLAPAPVAAEGSPAPPNWFSPSLLQQHDDQGRGLGREAGESG